MVYFDVLLLVSRSLVQSYKKNWTCTTWRTPTVSSPSSRYRIHTVFSVTTSLLLIVCGSVVIRRCGQQNENKTKRKYINDACVFRLLHTYPFADTYIMCTKTNIFRHCCTILLTYFCFTVYRKISR